MTSLALAALMFAEPPYPLDVTERTLKSPATLATMQRAGTPIFVDRLYATGRSGRFTSTQAMPTSGSCCL